MLNKRSLLIGNLANNVISIQIGRQSVEYTSPMRKNQRNSSFKVT
jgi:hypothetical protein